VDNVRCWSSRLDRSVGAPTRDFEGTTTSVAGVDGSAVQWSPQVGPTDLPAFIDRINCRVKVGLAGSVRMETPVIYFYAPREMTVNVRARKGRPSQAWAMACRLEDERVRLMAQWAQTITTCPAVFPPR
jgi:hypothetical protein